MPPFIDLIDGRLRPFAGHTRLPISARGTTIETAMQKFLRLNAARRIFRIALLARY